MFEELTDEGETGWERREVWDVSMHSLLRQTRRSLRVSAADHFSKKGIHARDSGSADKEAEGGFLFFLALLKTSSEWALELYVEEDEHPVYNEKYTSGRQFALV